jgi:hypothetical protein
LVRTIIINNINLGKGNRICYTGDNAMLGFRLRLKRLTDGRLTFTIPVGYKALLLLIGLLILVSMIVTREEGGGSIFIRENTIPLIICLISLLGAAYHERWIFDKAGDQVVHQNGLIFFHSNKVYRFSDIKRIEMSRLGMAGKEHNRSARSAKLLQSAFTLVLVETTGRVHNLETYGRLQLQRAEATASAIATYCAVPFVNSGKA